MAMNEYCDTWFDTWLCSRRFQSDRRCDASRLQSSMCHASPNQDNEQVSQTEKTVSQPRCDGSRRIGLAPRRTFFLISVVT